MADDESAPTTSTAPIEPVLRLPGEENDPPPRDGTALCLSGGGYRAMLFHAGVLWRLVDTGRLTKIDRISSVSGGSITAATLALAWPRLALDQPDATGRYVEHVVEPLRGLAGKTIDVKSVIRGVLTPATIGERLAAAYRQELFGKQDLQALPEHPRFVINATNMDSGALWRFSRPYMADWRVGRIADPTVEIAVAVAASSAFPPILSPYVLKLSGASWMTDDGNTLTSPEHRDKIALSDGGVYDNLGIETAWKRCLDVLVSDAGGHLGDDASPARDWARHTIRVLHVIDNQVRSLRKRQVISAYQAASGDPAHRDGAYLGIRSDIANYKLADALPCPEPQTRALADIPTRLAKIGKLEQQRLINWGYAICDAALRRHVDGSIAPPDGFPYPAAAVG